MTSRNSLRWCLSRWYYTILKILKLSRLMKLYIKWWEKWRVLSNLVTMLFLETLGINLLNRSEFTPYHRIYKLGQKFLKINISLLRILRIFIKLSLLSIASKLCPIIKMINLIRHNYNQKMMLRFLACPLSITLSKYIDLRWIIKNNNKVVNSQIIINLIILLNIISIAGIIKEWIIMKSWFNLRLYP